MKKIALFVLMIFMFLACGNSKTLSVSTTKKNETLRKKDVSNEGKRDIDKAVSFLLVENPPVYPGCEGLDVIKTKKCFSQNIQRFVGHNFNTDVLSKLGLMEKTKVLIAFTIDENGNVTNVNAKSKYKELRDEAYRVISMLPKMKPAYVKDRTVKVTYTLPLIFKVDDSQPKKH